MYKLNLFKSSFALNAQFSDSQYPSLWASEEVGARLHATTSTKPVFLLHDGPPYANGSLHLGHLVNKTLKDATLKFKRVQGYHAPFVPGFDCHGLPVELEVERQGVSKQDPQAFVTACRTYAKSQVAAQTSQFKAFGVAADWNAPYLTLDPEFEYGAAKLFTQMGATQRLRPVHWCADCGSSLAEAEVEYAPKKSPSLTVLFPVAGKENWFLEVWTTTPHTLVANQAVAFNPNVRYAMHPQQDGRVVVKASMDKSLASVELSGLTAVSPFTKKEVPVLAADYVSDAGTGLVHLAPSFGTDDFRVGEQYGLPVTEWLDDKGLFKVEPFVGMSMAQVASVVTDKLYTDNLVVALTQVEHEYPFCWRHKKPTFFKTSKEWFMELAAVAPKALEALNDVSFVPASGRSRLTAMLQSRPAWCVSRNRAWGTPLADPSSTLESRLLEEVRDHGVEAWQSQGLKKTLDVWFDSGVTHELVMVKRFGRTADVYLEGSDQHRGWFQSSLLTAAALGKASPYKTLVTHGFVVDEKGKKLSKSNKNYVPVEKLLATYGPDALRLWTLQQDFTKELRFSESAMRLTVDRYKKLRNTFRFCLQNLQDFEGEPLSLTNPLHQVQVQLLDALTAQVMQAANQWNFALAVQLLTAYAEKLSSDYFTVLKDVLYCDEANSHARKEAQSCLFFLMRRLLVLMTPVLSFSCEEVFQELKRFFEGPSVLLLSLEDAPLPTFKFDVTRAWSEVQEVHTEAKRYVQHQLDAGVSLKSTEHLDATVPFKENSVELALFNQLGYASVTQGPQVAFRKAEMDSCDCCRRRYGILKNGLCLRCLVVQTN